MSHLVVLTCILACVLPGHAWFTRHYSPLVSGYDYNHAECDMVNGAGSGISGIVRMRQAVGNLHPIYTRLEVEVFVMGLDPTDAYDSHGIHIHEYGDTSDGCKAAGGHYNPLNTDHGAPSNEPTSRHVGDWGNGPEKNGTMRYKFTDYLSSLTGDYSIYGRSIVLHEKKDDLGKGGNVESLLSGNAGRRLACCIIRRVKGDF